MTCQTAARSPPRSRSGRQTEDAMSVYRVIDVIGTSTQSWEDAAATAVKTASQTLRDLRVAEVVEQDLHIERKGRRDYLPHQAPALLQVRRRARARTPVDGQRASHPDLRGFRPGIARPWRCSCLARRVCFPLRSVLRGVLVHGPGKNRRRTSAAKRGAHRQATSVQRASLQVTETWPPAVPQNRSLALGAARRRA